MAEHRKQVRQAVMARVQVSWSGASGERREARATVDDKSIGGVGIVIAEEVPVGTILEIKSHREQFSGTVVRCEHRQDKYFLGVQRNA